MMRRAFQVLPVFCFLSKGTITWCSFCYQLSFYILTLYTTFLNLCYILQLKKKRLKMKKLNWIKFFSFWSLTLGLSIKTTSDFKFFKKNMYLVHAKIPTGSLSGQRSFTYWEKELRGKQYCWETLSLRKLGLNTQFICKCSSLQRSIPPLF